LIYAWGLPTIDDPQELDGVFMEKSPPKKDDEQGVPPFFILAFKPPIRYLRS